jgi:hypothetical protein
MSKRSQRNGAKPHEPVPSIPPAGSRWIAPVAVIAALAVFAYVNSRQTSALREAVDFRLDQVDSQLAQVSKKVDQVATRSAAPAPTRGPDPNRVYPIKTDGSPSKGPLTAAVTIAEFSDFQ